MALTLLSMCLGSLLIAVLRGYETIAILALILFLVARLLQGFSVGGKMGPATAFLVESAPDTNPVGRLPGNWRASVSRRLLLIF